MTLLQAYVTFGIPAIALSLALAGLYLQRRDLARLEQRQRERAAATPAE